MSSPNFSAGIVFFPTADLQACANFYETVLLLPLVVDQGTCRIYRVADSSYLGFCQSESAAEPDQRLILTFVCDDVDDWYGRLVAQRVPTDAPPRFNEQYRIYHFFARDPDGYRLEVQRFEHPFPPEHIAAPDNS